MPVPVDRVTIIVLPKKNINRLCGESSLILSGTSIQRILKRCSGKLSNQQHAHPGLSQQRCGRPTTVDLPMQPELDQHSLHCSTAWDLRTRPVIFVVQAETQFVTGSLPPPPIDNTLTNISNKMDRQISRKHAKCHFSQSLVY